MQQCEPVCRDGFSNIEKVIGKKTDEETMKKFMEAVVTTFCAEARSMRGRSAHDVIVCWTKQTKTKAKAVNFVQRCIMSRFKDEGTIYRTVRIRKCINFSMYFCCECRGCMQRVPSHAKLCSRAC